MKKLFSVLFVMLLLLTGCSSGDNTSDESDEEVVLNLFIPGSYIDPEILDEFYDETGIKINENDFESNEWMLTQLESGKVYDIIIPSDYMIEYLIENKMVQKLDKSLISNIDQLYDGVKNPEFDPNNDYSIPYFWGNVGICFNTEKIDRADVEKEGWDFFHDTKYKGLMYFYDSERDEFMIAQKALGYSMNTKDENELTACADWLRQITDTMDPFIVTDEAIDGLAYPEDNDHKYFGMMYSGDAAYILSENENAGYIAPESGTNYFIDAMCVDARSKHLKEACEFINFMISYDAQYQNSSYVGYSSVNAQAFEDLAKDEFEGNEAYVPRAKNANDESFHFQDSAHRTFLSESWIHIKDKNK